MQVLLSLLMALAAAVVYLAIQAVYDCFFHPLRHVPGPKLNAISRFPYIKHHLDGTAPFYLRKLHEQYGDVVRYSISEVSFISGETAWTDIYGHRTGPRRGHPTLEKDPAWYAPPVEGVQSLLFEPDEPHHRRRRAWAHSFSDKSLVDQFPTVQAVSDLLVERLGEAKGAVDMCQYFSWTMFDIVSTLIYGKPLGNLQELKTHKNVKIIQDGLQAFRFCYILWCYPLLNRLTGYALDEEQISTWVNHDKWLHQQTWDRVNRGPTGGKKDFISYVVRIRDGDAEDEKAAVLGFKKTGVMDKELHVDSGLFLTAGTDTTAHVLTWAIYFLCRHPTYLAMVTKEIRGRFTSYDDIVPESVGNMPVLTGVINETLRLQTPTAVGFGRRVGKGGEFISDRWIAEGTGVQVSQYPNNRSSRNFANPDEFIPERWMGDDRFASDKRESFQPFSVGARNCIGKSLAQTEMRLIISKLLWKFDPKLDESIGDEWATKSIWKMTWVKDALLVEWKPAQRT